MTLKKGQTYIGIKLPIPLRKAVEKLAKKDGRLLSSYVRRLMELDVKRKNGKAKAA